MQRYCKPGLYNICPPQRSGPRNGNGSDLSDVRNHHNASSTTTHCCCNVALLLSARVCWVVCLPGSFLARGWLPLTGSQPAGQYCPCCLLYVDYRAVVEGRGRLGWGGVRASSSLLLQYSSNTFVLQTEKMKFKFPSFLARRNPLVFCLTKRVRVHDFGYHSTLVYEGCNQPIRSGRLIAAWLNSQPGSTYQRTCYHVTSKLIYENAAECVYAPPIR